MDGKYDFYLDAIRIYDLCGKGANPNGAYTADGEGWPVYTELRNNIISAEGVTTTTDVNGKITVTFSNDDTLQQGAIFIDCNDEANSIKDYVSYGPNNELYLAENQAIAFNVTVPGNVADIQLGIKVANGNSVTYEINGDSYTVNSATDMYYSILKYAQAGSVTIKNVSGGILSLTNIKVTHTSAPTATADYLWMSAETASYALMSLRPAAEEEIPEDTIPEETTPEENIPEDTTPDEDIPEDQKRIDQA